MKKKAASRPVKAAKTSSGSESRTMVRPRVLDEQLASLDDVARSKGINQNAAICIAIAEFIERNRQR